MYHESRDSPDCGCTTYCGDMGNFASIFFLENVGVNSQSKKKEKKKDRREIFKVQLGEHFHQSRSISTLRANFMLNSYLNVSSFLHISSYFFETATISKQLPFRLSTAYQSS